jgi:hypothetical protein
MKRTPTTLAAISVALWLFHGVGDSCHAQTATESTNQYSFIQVPAVPNDGTFWSMQLTNFPPFPMDPFPTLPLYQWQPDGSTNSDGQYYFDDRSLDYVTNGAEAWGFSMGQSNRQRSSGETMDEAPHPRAMAPTTMAVALPPFSPIHLFLQPQFRVPTMPPTTNFTLVSRTMPQTAT